MRHVFCMIRAQISGENYPQPTVDCTAFSLWITFAFYKTVELFKFIHNLLCTTFPA